MQEITVDNKRLPHLSRERRVPYYIGCTILIRLHLNVSDPFPEWSGNNHSRVQLQKSTAQTMTTKPEDRRNFFRINQDVLFEHKHVDSFTAEKNKPTDEFQDAVSMSLINELRQLDKDSVQTLKLLTDKNRLLGDYLNTLSNKIDLIARHALFSQDTSSEDNRTSRVNLSEDGVSFVNDRAIYKGNHIAIRMIFLPSYVPVVTFAQVLRCEQKGDAHRDSNGESYHIAVKFIGIDDKDRQELSRQILKAQVARKKI